MLAKKLYFVMVRKNWVVSPRTLAADHIGPPTIPPTLDLEILLLVIVHLVALSVTPGVFKINLCIDVEILSCCVG